MPPIDNRDWLDTNKLRIHLEEHLLKPLLGTPVIPCEYGDGPLAPSESVIPYAEENRKVETLWILLSGLKAFRSNCLDAKKRQAGA